MIAASGLCHKLIKFPEQIPPDADAEKECINKLPIAFQFIRQQIMNGNVVLVHCVAGCDRTGFVMAYYLCATLSLSPEEGIARVRNIRPCAILASGWEEMILPVMRKLLEKETK